MDVACAEVDALRAAVAARALNMLPSAVGPDAAAALASGGAPRVVTHRSVPVLVVLILVAAGAIIGWALCGLCPRG